MVEFEGIELMLRWIGEGRGSAVMILNNLIYDEVSQTRCRDCCYKYELFEQRREN